MNKWYSREFIQGEAARSATDKINKLYLSLTRSTGVSRYVAVFCRYDMKLDRTTIFFSPQATVLADAFGARPCDKPIPEHQLQLLAGNSKSWEIHFPSHKPVRP